VNAATLMYYPVIYKKTLVLGKTIHFIQIKVLCPSSFLNQYFNLQTAHSNMKSFELLDIFQ